MSDDFLSTTLPVLGNTVHRVGLACNYGISNDDVAWALDEGGLNYLFWTPRHKGVAAIKAALKRDRERYVVMTGPTTAHWEGNLTRYVEKTLKKLDVEYLDVLMTFWVGITSRLNQTRLDELVALRESGKVRAVGCSIHDRKKAGELAADSPLDLLMIRYNAAHPGAERDIFPHLQPDRPRAVVAYTATRWRKLLKKHKKWDGAPMTAGECYRFCLSDPHVNVVLTGPKTRAQLEESLAEIAKGPLTQDEVTRIRAFGQVVHG
jgi:aryl-alcohol dehydrogenase-like predicted oxidoreductase